MIATPWARVALMLGLAGWALGRCTDKAAEKAAAPAPSLPAAHSSSMALSADGQKLFVVNPESDSVSVIDTRGRQLEREILLADSAPAVVKSTGNFTPAVMPRALALSPDERTLYVTGQRSGAVHVIDVASGALRQTVAVGSEPVGVLLSRDAASLFVACSQDNTVERIDTASLRVSATTAVPAEPWALAWSSDGETLLVSHLLGPGVSALDPQRMSRRGTWPIPDLAPRGNRRLAHGQVRGIYDLASRPGTGEVWTVHTLLGTDTAQPKLDFESTAFPAISVLSANGSFAQTMTTDAQDVAGVDGSFADVVSGPQAIAFTPQGDYALLVDANSEDVLVVDAARRVESALVRPLPGRVPNGIVLSRDGRLAYLDERGSGDIAVLRLDRSGGKLVPAVDGPAIRRLSSDPMPAALRLGLQLFNSANSSAFPITRNHWLACATCHLEGRSDAVTWLFAQGPRDTPSNAGGMLRTGFLFRTADRRQVADYWHTINIEQGGRFEPQNQGKLLDALSAYVNFALPLPIPPTTDAALVARGARVFEAAGCGRCHAGSRFTDSGAGNPELDLAGPVVLHDVGTCADAGTFPDIAHADTAGHARAACDFDTPSLNGVASSPPYLHDGRASTLQAAILAMPDAPSAAADLSALVEYVRSL